MSRIIFWLFVTALLIGPAAAQNSNPSSTPRKSGPDPLQTSTKPLTPKSAMPAQRKSSIAVPAASNSKGSTNAELSRLERQKPKTGAATTSAKAPEKGTSANKSSETSADNGVNFKYKQPAGGMKAATPDANTRNSSTPRVKKH